MVKGYFRKRARAPGVRASLAALVVGSVLPIAAVAAFLIVNFYQHERARLVESSISRARSLMAVVDHDIQSTQAALAALATARTLADDDLAAFHARALEVLTTLKVDSIVLLDADGGLLLSTRRPFGQALPRLAATPLLKRILASGKPGVSDLFTGPIDGNPIYVVGVPVRHGHALRRTLNATVAPERLAATLAEQKLPDSWRAAIVDSRGQVVARSHDIARHLGRQVRPGLLQQLSMGDEGGFASESLDGLPVFSVYSRSPVSRWTAVLAIPRDELAAGLRRTLAWLIVATLAALGAALALAWRIGGGIAGSVRALVAPARAVASGAPPALPPLRFREANELGLALREAAASVRDGRAATRESEQRLALVAGAARVGIWVRDLARRQIWVSDPWRALLGFEAAQEVTLDALLARVHPDDRAAVRHTLDGALRGSLRYEMEYRVVLPGGALRWIGSHGAAEVDEHGQATLVRGVSLDITPRKLAELDLQHQ